MVFTTANPAVQETFQMTTTLAPVDISCAVEVFIAAALLHREQFGRPEFTMKEIVERVEKENIAGELRPGISVHASQHCVANRPPNPAKHRMLFATGKHTRRLLLPGDEIHPERTGKIFPDVGEVPEQYLPLLEWAKQRYASGSAKSSHLETLLQARGIGAPMKIEPIAKDNLSTPEQWLASLFELEGLGNEHWKDEDPDEFVRKLREGWE